MNALKVLIAASVLGAAILSPSIALAGPPAPLRILFVGNSLTYYHSLPDLVTRLLDRDGRSIASEQIVGPGTSLRDHLNAGLLAKELGAHRYDVVVFQEIGGFPLCDPSAALCAAATGALAETAALIRRHRARPVWYSTWQHDTTSQRYLTGLVQTLADQLHVPAVDAGALLYQAMERVPRNRLLRDDGHPQVLGSWIIARALAAAIDPKAPEHLAAESVCSPDWENHEPDYRRLLSTQFPPPVVCVSLSADDAGFVGSIALQFNRKPSLNRHGNR